MITTPCRRARINEPVDVTAVDGSHSRFDAGECEVEDLGERARIYAPANHQRPKAEISGEVLSALLAHRQLVFLSWH